MKVNNGELDNKMSKINYDSLHNAETENVA